MTIRFTASTLAALALLTSAAFADDRTEGATIRLIAEPPDEAGRIRGAVVFDLEPGWKTYWLDPGETGLAPLLDFTASDGVSAPRLSFPAPSRLTEGAQSINGYDEPMAVAFETEGVAEGRLVLSLRAGLCRTLCVPVTLDLTRDLSEPLSMDDAMAIDRTFLALPQNEGIVAAARLEGDALFVEKPQGFEAAQDLFVAAPGGWRFGEAVRAPGAAWRVPIRERPTEGATPSLDGVLIDSDEAVSLTIELPQGQNR